MYCTVQEGGQCTVLHSTGGWPVYYTVQEGAQCTVLYSTVRWPVYCTVKYRRVACVLYSTGGWPVVLPKDGCICKNQRTHTGPSTALHSIYCGKLPHRFENNELFTYVTLRNYLIAKRVNFWMIELKTQDTKKNIELFVLQ